VRDAAAPPFTMPRTDPKAAAHREAGAMGLMSKPDAQVPDALGRGREHYRQGAWADAYRTLTIADQTLQLSGEDLECLAMSAYLVGRDDDYLTVLDRAYAAHLDAGASARAACCAAWLSLRLLFRGETGHATGWLARIRRLLEGEKREGAAHGYVLLPIAQLQIVAGDWGAAYTAAARATGIGERFGERDLSAFARHLQGRIRIEQGRVAEGLALLDEAMLAVVAGELSPLVTGLVYCSAIEGCEQVYALDRVREWTGALARWCGEKPDMVAFSGACMVHRAGMLQLLGAWPDAIDEARRAGERCLRASDHRAAAAAFYRQAELHRLRGDFAAAEAAYRSASEGGWDPQPGLALLRVAQGRLAAALAATRRALEATAEPFARTRLLPAHIEILLDAGEMQEARESCRELERIAQCVGTPVLGALSAQARAAIDLAAGDAQAALDALRRAWQVWEEIDAPYLRARAAELMAQACAALGDIDGHELQLAAARAEVVDLGAAPDLARIDAPARDESSGAHGLTRRELQVLRLVAAGKTNKAIAAELLLSGKTVDRHVSHILTKLDLPSRVAATAYAYRHQMV
jgi:DNA-binding CsgD family transcriptional regulator